MGERVEKKEEKKGTTKSRNNSHQSLPGPTEYPSVYPPADEAPGRRFLEYRPMSTRLACVLLVLTCSYVSVLSLPGGSTAWLLCSAVIVIERAQPMACHKLHIVICPMPATA